MSCVRIKLIFHDKKVFPQWLPQYIIKRFWKFYFVFVKRSFIPSLGVILYVSNPELVLTDWEIEYIVRAIEDYKECALGDDVVLPLEEKDGKLRIAELPSTGCGLG